MIALEDLKDMTEQEVIQHLAYEYSGEEKYDTPNNEQVQKAKEMLEQSASTCNLQNVSGC